MLSDLIEASLSKAISIQNLVSTLWAETCLTVLRNQSSHRKRCISQALSCKPEIQLNRVPKLFHSVRFCTARKCLKKNQHGGSLQMALVCTWLIKHQYFYYGICVQLMIFSIFLKNEGFSKKICKDKFYFFIKLSIWRSFKES